MFEQALLVPALHLWAEVHLRRYLCLQRACAPLKARPPKAPSGASPEAPDEAVKGKSNGPLVNPAAAPLAGG
jgi:hypothetical protein